MSKRTFAPKSRQFNERMIERVQSRYDSGMTRDIESLDIGPRGLADLINARAHKTDVRGRPGCELVTPADFGATIDNTETISTAIQSGALYEAEGRNKDADTQPDADSKFMVYDDTDTFDTALATAKGEAPRKYDVFQVDSSTNISYLGSVKLPALEGFGDTVASELTASKSGTTITVSVGTVSSALLNQYWDWGDGTELITSVDTVANTVEVENSSTRASTDKCRVQGRINASWYHQSQKKLVAQIGRKLYVANDVPWYQWTEIEREGSYYELDDSFCKMYEFDDDLILVNGSGYYRIKIDDSTDYRYWRMNDRSPEYENRTADIPVDDSISGAYLSEPYRYILKYARIKSSHWKDDRYTDGAIVEWESGSAKADGDGQDYFELAANKPIGRKSWTASVDIDGFRGFLVGTRQVGAQLTGGYELAAGWTSITDGVINMTARVYSSDTEYLSINIETDQINFSSVTSLEDVAELIEGALNVSWLQQNFSFSVSVERRSSSGPKFIIESNRTGIVVTTFAGVPSQGTQINANMGFTGTYTAGYAFYDSNTVLDLVLEDDVRAATHYAIYRTKVLSDEGIDAGNNPNLYVHVADVPIVYPMVVRADSTTYYEVVGNFSRVNGVSVDGYDEFGQNFSVINIIEQYDPPALSVYGTVMSYDQMAIAFGSSSVGWASVTGSTMTVSSGTISLTALDEGKPVWFASGELRWIKKVTSSTTATLTKSGNIDATAIGMNPTARRFTDEVFDDIVKTYTNAIEPRIKSHTLPTRFTQEMPNANIGKVVPGWLFGAVQGSNNYQYSDTSKDYLAGSYAPDLQYNDKIDGAIQEFLHQTDYVGIRTEFGTWRLNLATVNELGDPDIGQNIDGFNDPEIADNSVGSEGEGGTAILENGNSLTFTSEPSVREFNMFEYGENLAHERIQESDIQELEPHTIMMYDHILGMVLWGTK